MSYVRRNDKKKRTPKNLPENLIGMTPADATSHLVEASLKRRKVVVTPKLKTTQKNSYIHSSNSSGNSIAPNLHNKFAVFDSSSAEVGVHISAGANNPKHQIIIDMESALNSGETDKIQKFFSANVAETCSLYVDLCVLKQKISGNCNDTNMIREIHGDKCIASYFIASIAAVPDTITVYSNCKATKMNDGNLQLDASALTIGQQVYEVDVIEDEQFKYEQEDIESAVAQLTSLSGGVSSNSKPKETSQDTSKYGNLVGKQPRSIHSTSILIVRGKTEFLQGKPLPVINKLNYKGQMTWIVSKDRKVSQMKFTLLSEAT